MAQFSVKIIRLNGAVLDENQHLAEPYFAKMAILLKSRHLLLPVS
jgi:hypothetical protein